MLGAAGRAASGLVKQAAKAGNVSTILPASAVARKYPQLKAIFSSGFQCLLVYYSEIYFVL